MSFGELDFSKAFDNFIFFPYDTKSQNLSLKTLVYTEKYTHEDNKITELWKIAVGVLSGAMMAGMAISFLMDFGEVCENNGYVILGYCEKTNV